MLILDIRFLHEDLQIHVDMPSITISQLKSMIPQHMSFHLDFPLQQLELLRASTGEPLPPILSTSEELIGFIQIAPTFRSFFQQNIDKFHVYVSKVAQHMPFEHFLECLETVENSCNSEEFEVIMNALSKNRTVTYQTVLDHPELRWSYAGFSENRNVTWEHVNMNRNVVWSFDGLSKNPNMSMAIVLENLDKNWNFHNLSSNPCIDMHDIDSNLHLPWEWEEVSRNPNLTEDYVNSHRQFEWDWNYLCRTHSDWKIVQSPMFSPVKARLNYYAQWTRDDIIQNRHGHYPWARVVEQCREMKWSDWYFMMGSGRVTLGMIAESLAKRCGDPEWES